jgi:transposase-like protein
MLLMERKQRSREFWEKAVEFAEASSLTQAQCAKKLGVGQHALSYWLCKLRRERRGAERQGSLVPVKILSAEPATHGLELDIESGLLRFSEKTSPTYVAQFVRALRQC